MKDILNWPAWLILFGSVLAAGVGWWFRSQRQKRKREALVFLGAVLAITGGFWASSQQESYERRIAELNNTILSQITGGDSYCYVKAGSLDLNPQRFWVLSVWQVWKEPCYDVTIQIKDVDKFRGVMKGHSEKSPQEVFAAFPYIQIGTVPPKFLAPVFRQLDLQEYDKRHFSFSVSFRNGWVFKNLL